MEAIRWEDSALYLLDQTRLPAAEDWLRYTDYRQVAKAIQTMVVRGAPAIGITAAYAMVLAAQENACKGDFPAAMSRAKAVLAASRPTAVNLFWALDRMENLWLSAGPDLPRLEEEARAIHREDVLMNDFFSLSCFHAFCFCNSLHLIGVACVNTAEGLCTRARAAY